MRFFVALLLRMTPKYAVSGWKPIGFQPYMALLSFVRQYATIADSSKGGGNVFPGRADAEK